MAREGKAGGAARGQGGGVTDASGKGNVDKAGSDGVCNCRRKSSILDNFGRQGLDPHNLGMRFYRVWVTIWLLQSMLLAVIYAQ